MSQYLQKFPDPYPHGIVFHYFHGGKHRPAQGSIATEDLGRTIEYIGVKHILPAREWLRRAETGGLQNTDICITFDDGLREQYDIALPVLEAHGITAFFFVYSSPMEGIPVKLELYRHIRNACFPSVNDFYRAFDTHVARSSYAAECAEALRTFDANEYMKPFPFHTPEDKKFRFLRDDVLGSARYDELMAQIAEDLHRQGVLRRDRVARDLWMDDAALRDLHVRGHVVGLHSYNHPTTMATLSADEQREEYGRNARHLARILPQPPTTMSHPCNSFNDATAGVLRELGITLGFRADMGKGDGPYSYPRNDNTNLLRALHGS